MTGIRVIARLSGTAPTSWAHCDLMIMREGEWGACGLLTLRRQEYLALVEFAAEHGIEVIQRGPTVSPDTAA